MNSRSKLPSVQMLTDKMSRLTNRKTHNPKLLLNELTSGDKNVTFSGKTNNHSTSTTRAASSEGKNETLTREKHTITHSSPAGLDQLAFEISKICPSV